MTFTKSAATALLLLAGIACGKQQDHKRQKQQSLQAISSDTAIVPQAAIIQREVEQADQQHGADRAAGDWDKKIVKTGTLTVEIDDYRKYNDNIHQSLGKWEAYISTEHENSSDYKIENNVTIRIPVQYFDEAMQRLSAQQGKLLVKDITSQDVTGEFLDTRARLEARKRVRLRYLDMLQKTHNMEEVLQVEREINSIQEQIEAAQGRSEYLSHSAAYSTIQLTFYQVLNPDASQPQEPAFGKRILTALSEGWKWIGELVLVFISIWPVWFAVAFLIWIVKRRTAYGAKNATVRV